MRRAREVLGRLYVLYHEDNERHFAGLLPALQIRIEDVGGKRGEVEYIAETQLDATGKARCIVFYARHVLTASWAEVEMTMRHEVIHVWQAEMGYEDHHGLSFRRMAKRLGVPTGRTVD